MGNFLTRDRVSETYARLERTVFFRHEQIWKKFVKKHFDDFQKVSENEKSVDDYRKENPGESLSKILKIRDQEFTNQVINDVKENFGKTKRNVETENEKTQPKILLINALAKLDAVDIRSDAFEDLCRYDSNLREIIVSIGQKHFRIKKAVEKIEPDEDY